MQRDRLLSFWPLGLPAQVQTRNCDQTSTRKATGYGRRDLGGGYLLLRKK